MINVLLSGACGKMGNAVARCCKEEENVNVVAGVDKAQMLCDFPIYSSFDDVKVIPDVIIDFSHISVLENLLKFAIKNNNPVVLATTGYSAEQIEKIKDASSKIPVFFTANMSLGVNLLCSLAKTAAKILNSNFDIEIIEKHHNKKLDAPSGTALAIADAIADTMTDDAKYVYERQSVRKQREKSEIGIHAVRGGTIVGEHEVIFAGTDEIITLSHSAASREVFAQGAVKAALFMSGKPKGFYSMDDLFA